LGGDAVSNTPQWSARLPDDIKMKLLTISEKDRRSMTEEVSFLIEKRYEELEKPEK
jgi:predicted DNA-binding protein